MWGSAPGISIVEAQELNVSEWTCNPTATTEHWWRDWWGGWWGWWWLIEWSWFSLDPLPLGFGFTSPSEHIDGIWGKLVLPERSELRALSGKTVMTASNENSKLYVRSRFTRNVSRSPPPFPFSSSNATTIELPCFCLELLVIMAADKNDLVHQTRRVCFQWQQ